MFCVSVSDRAPLFLTERSSMLLLSCDPSWLTYMKIIGQGSVRMVVVKVEVEDSLARPPHPRAKSDLLARRSCRSRSRIIYFLLLSWLTQLAWSWLSGGGGGIGRGWVDEQGMNVVRRYRM